MQSVFTHRFFEGGTLPASYSRDGMHVSFRTDFRVWLRYQYLQNQSQLSAKELSWACAALCCSGNITSLPADFLQEAMTWFHSCADMERLSRITISERMREDIEAKPMTISLFWDFRQLWNSFKKQYDIDLYACGDMHWWEFKRLLEGLGEDCSLANLRRLRSVTEAEFKGLDGRLKQERSKAWGDLVLERKYAALPDEE